MIGLWDNERHWQQLLSQEGVPVRTAVGNDLSGLSVLVLDQPVDRAGADLVRAWVEKGGCVLTGAGCGRTVWPELIGRRRRLDYILPDDSPLFRNIGVIDLETSGWMVSGRTMPLVLRQGQGYGIILPFEPGAVLSQEGYGPKWFYAETPRFPYEVVASVNRGEVRRLVANSLRHLLAAQGLPYVRLSDVPGPNRSLFGFRIDTDFSPYAQLEITAAAADRAVLVCSWFINTGAHQPFLATLKTRLTGHDVQLHCHTHRVYPDYERNLANFAKGRELLRAAGLKPIGVAAPFGEWNDGLAAALAQLGFEFSSEFCYAYDDLPSRPMTKHGLSPVLQIPVHPICVGRLLRARANERQIFDYFCQVIRRQVARLEPCFLYDHPQRISQFPQLFTELFRYGIERCGGQITIADFAHWWQQREQVRYSVSVEPAAVTITVENPAPDVFVIIEKEGRFARAPLQSGRLALAALDWQPLPEPVTYRRRSRQLRRGKWQLAGHELIRAIRKRLQPG